jgi:Mg2+ and Co2+ transporter CorA
MELNLETIFQVLNRLGALSEQCDYLEQAFAQSEMQSEVLARVPTSKQIPGQAKELHDQLVSSEAYRDAVLRSIKEITGKDIGELRIALVELRQALTKYAETQNEYIKVKQAHDILAETNDFDPEPGEGGSRQEFVEELTRLSQSKEFLTGYLRRLTLACLNQSSIVRPTDSVLGALMRERDKES